MRRKLRLAPGGPVPDYPPLSYCYYVCFQEWAFEQRVKLPSIKKSRLDDAHVCNELKISFDFNVL
jgi:hypothetical protein